MRKLIGLTASALLFCTACTSTNNTQTTSSEAPVDAASQSASLQRTLAPFFHIGTALNAEQVAGNPAHVLDFVTEHFDSVTAENAMKWETIQPHEGEYVWDHADRLVELAERHNLYLVGHTIVWHQQTPAWVFNDLSGAPADRALILERLKTHIAHYVGRYKGRVEAWDVVNEALNEDGTLRDSPWLRQLGDDYIEIAFRLVHEADPNAKLIYNDYNLFKPEKRAGAVALIERLKAQGIAIDAVGMQAHYGLDNPAELKMIEDSINAFAEAGVEVHITELDLTVLPFPDADQQGADITLNFESEAHFDPYAAGMTAEAEQAFNRRYFELFELFLGHSDKIARVTFWGVNDAQSWRNDWPMRGRTDYPLLVDRNYQLKPVAKTIMEYAETLK